MRNSSKLFLLFLCFVALSLGAAAQTPAKAKSPRPTGTHATAGLPSEDDVNQFLHANFGYEPQLSWKILSIKPSQAEGLAEVNVELSGPQGRGEQKFFVTRDGQHAVLGDIIAFGPRPFDKARAILEKKADGPARGPANAPVTIVEFSDLQCPHCKDANPTIEKLLSENPNIRFISQNFPLAIHNWAMKAAQYADCVGRTSNEAYWKFTASVYGAQTEITADNADQKLTELAEKSGVNGKDIAACAAKPETQARVEASINLGTSVDVNATPTLFINGRPVGMTLNNYEVLKQIVEFSAKQK